MVDSQYFQFRAIQLPNIIASFLSTDFRKFHQLDYFTTVHEQCQLVTPFHSLSSRFHRRR